MNKIKVIFSPTDTKPYIVIFKPRDLPSAPLTKDDKNNALFQAGELFPQLYNVKGKKEIEYGLLHRLDTVTDGLLVIATTQVCYDFLQNEQKEGRFIKYYSASCNIDGDNYKKINGYPNGYPYNNFSIPATAINCKYSVSSFFRGFGKGHKEVRPVTEDSGRAALKKTGKQKLYTTNILIKNVDKEKQNCTVECSIKEGYRHQVRCHLGWIGLPIINDELYNSAYSIKKAENKIMFSATKVEFYYPRGDLNSYEIALTWT